MNLKDIIQKLIPTVRAQTQPPGIPSPPSPGPGWGAGSDPNPVPAQLSDLDFVFHRIISALFFAGGLVAFAYLIIGGFKYLTSSGDEDALEMAKKTVTYAVVGLLIVLTAWLFLNTLGNILKLDLLEFTIPS